MQYNPSFLRIIINNKIDCNAISMESLYNTFRMDMDGNGVYSVYIKQVYNRLTNSYRDFYLLYAAVVEVEPFFILITRTEVDGSLAVVRSVMAKDVKYFLLVILICQIGVCAHYTNFTQLINLILFVFREGSQGQELEQGCEQRQEQAATVPGHLWQVQVHPINHSFNQKYAVYVIRNCISLKDFYYYYVQFFFLFSSLNSHTMTEVI